MGYRSGPLTLVALMLVVAACANQSPPQTQQPAPAEAAPPPSTAAAAPTSAPPASSANGMAGAGHADTTVVERATGGGGASPEPLAVVGGGPPWLELVVLDLRRVGTTVTLEFSVLVEDRLLQPPTRDVFASQDDQGFDLPDDTRASVSGVNLIDEVNRRRHVVLRDETGRCRCTSWAGITAAPGRHAHSASYPAPPEGVTEMTVAVPHFPAVTVPLRQA